MKAIATAALAAIVLTISMGASAAHPPPTSSKASSYAPRHSGSRVYGAPIQPPIVGPRKTAHHKATSSAKRAKATTQKPTTKKKAKKPGKAASPKPTPAAKG